MSARRRTQPAHREVCRLTLALAAATLVAAAAGAQSGATYTLQPQQLTAAAGTAAGPVTLRVQLATPNTGATPIVQTFRASFPAALAGHATMSPEPVSLSIASRASSAQSAPFSIVLAPTAPAGIHLVDIVRDPPAGPALLDVAPAPVARLRITITTAPTGAVALAVGPLQLRVSPSQAAVAPGETTAPVDVDVIFPSPLPNPTGTIQVTLPPQLVGKAQIQPTPLVFGARGTVAQVRTRMRVATRPDAPAGRWPIALQYGSPDLGTATATFLLEIRPQGDLALDFEPASLALCDGGPGARSVLRVAGSGGYRGSPRLQWGALPPGLTALPNALPAVQLPPDAAVPFELRAQGVTAPALSVAATATDSALGLQRSATLQVTVGKQDFAPAAGPAPIAIAQSAPARAFQLTLNPNTCLSAASVRVTLAGAPPGLVVAGFPYSFVGPGYAPLTFTLRALPQLAVGTYPLIATFTAPGVSPKQLTIPVEVQAPGRAQLLLAPAIDLVTPNQLQRGQQADLQLVGRNLKAGTQVGFGPGIQLLGVPFFASDSAGSVKVYVEPLAPLGLHLAQAQNLDGQSDGPGGVLVQPVIAAAAPRIDKVEPPQVDTGKSYLVKLTGQNLTPSITIDLGPGVTVVGPLLAAGPGALAAKIAVAPNAAAGQRLAQASGAGGASQGPGTLTVGGTPLQPVQTVQVQPLPFPKGQIFLEYPEWGTKDLGYFQAGYVQELGVPAVTDATRFEWREKNPGTASYFELRVLDKSGAKVVATRRIQPGMTIAGVKYPNLPDFYRPDPALLQELAASLPPTVVSAQAGPAGGPTVAAGSVAQLAAGALGASQPSGSPTVQLNPAFAAPPDPLDAAGPRDFLWEVAGFWLPGAPPPAGGSGSSGAAKLSPASGPLQVQAAAPGSPTPPQGIEVEISERWPLRMPKRPNGFACPTQGIHGDVVIGRYDVQNATDPNTYPGDLIQLQGTLDLDGAPYQSKPTPLPDPWEEFLAQYAAWQQQLDDAFDSFSSPFGGGGGGSKTGSQPTTGFKFWNRYQFDNVFIDWGDGTVEKLVGTTDQKTLQWSSYQKITLLTGGAAPRHAYKYPGSYVVRIYQIATADLQQVDPAQLAFAVDGYTGDPLLMLASMLTKKSGGQTPPWLGAPATTAADVASRAYLLFCSPVTVIPRLDPCARGRLQLTDIDIVGFPGHDVQDATSGQTLKLSPDKPLTVAKPTLAPGGTASSATTGVQNVVQAGAVSTLGVNVDGTATDCDEAMTARARLSYFGQGKAVVRFRWEDGTVFYTSPMLDLASAPRTNLGSDPSQWGEPKISTVDVDAPLSVDQLGVHGLSAEAEVIFDPLASILGAMLGAEGGGDVGACPNTQGPVSAVLFPTKDPLLTGSSPLTGKGPGPSATFQVGALMPMSGALPGGGGSAVLQLGALGGAQALQPKPSGKKSPPDFVQSPVHQYQVVSADPNKPCFFLFPTPQGTFRVTDVNSSVVAEGNGRYSGQGLLKLPLTASPDSFTETPLSVPFQHWLASDAQTVEEGTIGIAPQKDLTVPGMRARIAAVNGQAGQFMRAKLGLQPIQQSLVQPTATWTSEQPLTDLGDWIAGGQQLALTAIGASGFALESGDVTLDLSRSAGPAPGTSFCGPSNASFAGIHLGQATLHPFDFGLGGLAAKVPGWVIGSAGLCGAAQLSGMPQKSLGDGWLKIASLDAKAIGGGFVADYKGLQVFSPWFGKPLGPVDVKMYDSGGSSYGVSIPGLGDADLQDWGPVTMKATGIELVAEQGVDWALHGSTRFGFRTPDKKFFGQLDTDRLYFRLADSGVYFQGGKTTTDIPLQGVAQPQAPHLGKAPIDLLGVHLASNPGGSQPLQFDFQTLLHLSSAPELEAPKVHAGFAIGKQGSGFVSTGPNTAPFTSKMAFPLGNPQVSGSVAPAYQPGSTFFCGGLDLRLLGGSGLTGGTATFVLGYDESSGKDGWLAHYKVPMAGGSGIPIAPPLPINLFSIEGGLAYNIASPGADPKKGSNPFADPLTCQTPFAIKDSGAIFAAGAEVGTTDHTTVTARGMFSVSKTYGVRLDVDGWLLRSDHSGPGDIQGVLKWQNGAFTGKFWGGYKFLDDPFFGSGYAVALDLGSSESSAAVDILFDSSGDWHVKAGDQYGTPITGRVLFATSEAWLGLSGNGLSNLKLKAGGKQSFEVGGSIWKCDAKAYAEFGCGVTMGINPIQIGGSADASFGVSLCGVGFSLDGHVSLGCCAPYANVQLCAKIKPCMKCGDYYCYPSLCKVCGGFSL